MSNNYRGPNRRKLSSVITEIQHTNDVSQFCDESRLCSELCKKVNKLLDKVIPYHNDLSCSFDNHRKPNNKGKLSREIQMRYSVLMMSLQKVMKW